MANYTYINGNLSKLKTVLENSGLFDSVVTGDVTCQNSTTDGLNCIVGDVSFFEIGVGKTQVGQSTNNDTWSIYVRGNGINTQYYGQWSSTASYTKNNYKPIEAYQTENGLIIVCQAGRILLAKTQNGDIMIAFGYSYLTSALNTTDNVMMTIMALASTDTLEAKSARVTVETFGQTVLSPICTCSYGTSYADKAYIMTYKQYTIIGYIQYNGKRYFTDGFFAIEDEEESA